MAQYQDPRMPNYGRANFGQLRPNMTAANMQRPRNPGEIDPNQQPQSPMASSLQRAPQQPAPTPPPSGKSTAAVGTFGPKQIGPQTNPFAGIKNRGKTDFGHGGWQGGFNTANRMLNNIPWAPDAPLGIGRRAKTAGSDYSTQDAGTILQRGYQNSLGREASPEEIQSQLAGQGLKPGDRWVGKSGLDAILASLGQSPEAQGIPLENEEAPVAGGFQTLPDKSALGASLQRPSNVGAEQAYQEYLSEFPEGDPEQPLDFETFAGYYDQLGLEEQQSPMATALGEGRRGWNNIALDAPDQIGGTRFEGFNDERALSGGDPNSIKDLFRRVVGGLGIQLRPGMSWEETTAITNQIAEAMRAAGAQVDQVDRDKMFIRTNENPEGEWVDVIGAATGDDPRFVWLSEMADAGMNPMDFGMNFSSTESDEEEEGTDQQSALLNGLTGGANWKTLLDQLMSQYMNG